MSQPINVLLMGGGGREHALAIKLRQSPRLGRLFTTHADNPGLAALATPVDVPVNIREAYRLVQFLDKHNVSLVVIGPEDPLAEGWADKLRADGRLVFGPGADGARLEADKAWAKQLMRGASIPTAEARIFDDAAAATAFVRSRPNPPVIKAAGLAKGKGVFVPDTTGQAVDAIDKIMVAKIFGAAGSQVVIEERLEGPEVSVLALVDGHNIYVMETCQDHKRLGDGDSGPNTGGMGAFCPSRQVDEALMQRIERQVLVPTLDALRREGIDYRGVLYAGLMLTPAGPKVLEYNCRFGDPECQALMVRLESDLLDVITATCQGRLHEIDLAWKPGASCCIVLAAPGYPDSPRAGLPITGLEAAAAVPGVTIHHAGTRRTADGTIVTAGGRALGITAAGSSIEEARSLAYRAADLVHFEGKQMRRDIGIKA
ncbi:MAG: phosphoribosylamine--glycine ligase [Phycisphaeraceae bacterium]|nr:phosphoribosylamine--glycine ligase [Phycisphaeraceae bacterium]